MGVADYESVKFADKFHGMNLFLFLMFHDRHDRAAKEFSLDEQELVICKVMVCAGWRQV